MKMEVSCDTGAAVSRLPHLSRIPTPGNSIKRHMVDNSELQCSQGKKLRVSDSSDSSIESESSKIMPCPTRKPPRKGPKTPVGELRRSVSMASLSVPNGKFRKNVIGRSNLGSSTNLSMRVSSVTAATLQRQRPPVPSSVSARFTGSTAANKQSRTTAAAVRQPVANITNRVLQTRSQAKDVAAPNTEKSKTKRPAWDLKGRLMDMEGILKENCVKISEYDSRMSLLEAEKISLSENLLQTKSYSQGAEEEIAQLKEQLRTEKDERYAEKQSSQLRLRDLEFQVSTLERQKTTLDSELRMKLDEVISLKSALSKFVSSTSAMEAELKATKILLENANKKNVELGALCLQHAEKVQETTEKMIEGETERRKLHNMVQELKGNIRVFCRVRPLVDDEIARHGSDVIHHIEFLDEKSLELIKNGNLDGSSTSVIRNRTNNYEFSFDHVFGPSDTQSIVFEEISQLAQSAIDGYNVCVFAYGQTGSGKTFTMEGVYNSDDLQGMIPRTVKHIFMIMANLEDKGWCYKVHASFLEIYNETIRDLLESPKEAKNNQYEIKLVDGKKPDIYVTNLKVVPVQSEAEVYHLLSIAQQHRAVAATNINEHSSRSHSVFQLKISGKNVKTTDTCEGTLSLVDLAGSERLKESGSEGARLTETQNINKSLANLGNVIMALAQKQSHIPFRNSKLTHLLQNSLGGNSKTLMFVNVSPVESCFNETLNSLRFATKVNECQIGAAIRQIRK